MINKDILKHAHHSGFREEEIYESYKIFFGTLFSEPRLKIINFLRNGEKNVSEIVQELKIDQTAVSHNLARLKKCGFIIPERDGKFINYKLNQETIEPLIEIIEKHMLQHCIHILHNMKNKMKGGKKYGRK